MKMKRINTFQRLSLQEKIKILYVEGTFITSIRYYQYKINLYLLNGNYLEVFYHHKKDLIEKIELMERGNTRMKFYLDQVKLFDLPV